MTVKIDANKVTLQEMVNVPSTPDAGFVGLHSRTDGNLYQIDDNGNETILIGGAGDQIESWTELSATAASISIQNIPSDYTHLMLRLMLRTDNAAYTDSAKLWIDNDTTATNYIAGSIARSGVTSKASYFNWKTNAYLQFYCAGNTSPATLFTPITFMLFDYASTTQEKQIVMFAGGGYVAATFSDIISSNDGYMQYISTSAISRLDLAPITGSNFAIGTRYQLLGIAA